MQKTVGVRWREDVWGFGVRMSGKTRPLSDGVPDFYLLLWWFGGVSEVYWADTGIGFQWYDVYILYILLGADWNYAFLDPNPVCAIAVYYLCGCLQRCGHCHGGERGCASAVGKWEWYWGKEGAVAHHCRAAVWGWGGGVLLWRVRYDTGIGGVYEGEGCVYEGFDSGVLWVNYCVCVVWADWLLGLWWSNSGYCNA